MEDLKNETGVKVDATEQDYLAAIEELKQNTVAKADYEKLAAENKKLIKAVVSGQTSDIKVEEEQEETNQEVIPSDQEIQTMRQELFDPDKERTNIDYVEKALALRKAIMLKGGVDPFIPVGRRINATQEDIDFAEFTARVYQECLDYAQGDNEAFTTELMRRTKDNLPRRK